MTAQPLAIPSRSHYLTAQKERGRKVLGVFPAQYPREILWAHDIAPMEIWDPPLEPGSAPAHLQPYICAVVRQGLELVLRGGAARLDGLLVPHTCDSLQNLASLLNDYLELPVPVLFFYHPKEPFRDSARAYYRRQLTILDQKLAARFGPRREGALEQAVAWGQRVAELAGRTYDLRARGQLSAPALEFYRVLRAGEFLHPEDHIPLLEEFLAVHQGPAPAGPVVLLSGVLPNPKELLSLLDQQGARVGHDDFLGLSRRLLFPASQAADPFDALCEQYFALPPCSTRGSALSQRLDWLKGLAQASGARGVIFYVVKFCEPELFDVPPLMAGLKEQGLATMSLEVELNQGVSGQIATRVEAFLEMLS
ncbi:MAG: 2-hydroxyacyl-CoA dehydratase [Desulfarculus sp.]|nr:MAG: 2-hydroxyacyl-CoA dehydratase [Desulfarculus sp.]